jgi:LysM repeat protein
MKRLLALLTIAVLALLFILIHVVQDVLVSPPPSASLPQDVAVDPTLDTTLALAAVTERTIDSPGAPAAPVSATPTLRFATPFPRLALATATPTSAGSGPIKYTVQEGDWIYKIARQFAVTPEAIMAANPAIKPNLLTAGMVLVIPGTEETTAPRPAPIPTKTDTQQIAMAGTPSPSRLPTTATATTVTVATKPSPTPTSRPTVVLKAATSGGAAKRYLPPSTWMLGPIQGSGEDDRFINQLLWYIDEKNIPITAFHFDSDRWQSCANNADFQWNDALLQRMRSHNPPIRAVFWILPLITTNCPEYNVAASQGFFVRNADGSTMVTSGWQGNGSWIDFSNPQAVAYWHSLLDRIFVRAQGVIGGFYTDDLFAGLGTWYGDTFARDLVDYTRSKVPDGEVVMKAYGISTPDNDFLGRYAHTSYVNDMESSFAGMQEGIRRVMAVSSLLPAPFNEFTGYAMRVPDTETYYRRIQWGAMQPVMENDSLPKNGMPWDPQYPLQLLQSYQYFATLHWELVPYLHTYDELAYRDNTRIFQQPNAGNYSTGLGREIFVQYITDRMQSVSVSLPAGQWINYWNEQQVYTGPTTISYPVPFGREPIFIANGAIIPMQVRDGSTGHGTTASIGALTVNVFPSGHSTFSYSDKNQKWVLFDVRQTGNQVTLCTSVAPSQPLIYRIARWPSAPAKVTTLGGAVGVNTSWGTPLAPLGSETAVDASGGGWYYDSARQLLIVKVAQVGSSCP